MIPRRSLQYLNCLPLLVLLPCSVVHSGSETTNLEYFNAIVNVTAQEPGSKSVLDGGRYGLNSPITEVKGIIVTPVNLQGGPDRQGCDSHIRFPVPANTKHWIALLQRGNCTFKEKILRAASHNATAVVIYNNNSNEDAVSMTHAGTGDIVVIMISESTGREILSYMERNISVLMAIAVGSRSPGKNGSRGSLIFVSISFVVLMVISSAWLIFYFIQKIRNTSAHDRNQRRLGDAAKKAIGKLTTRTVRKGDKETDPDFDHCAVCIESYKQNDIVRVLPCKHVFHKVCVDPWLSEHCTCPMCKLNILKALGIVTNVPCSDNVAFDVERLTRVQPSTRGSAPSDPVEEGSLILESLRSSAISQLPHEGEITPRTGEINIAVTKLNGREVLLCGSEDDQESDFSHL